MYKYILQSVEDINWLAVGPLVLFFVFFVTVTIVALKREKSYIRKMENLPLEDELN